MSAALVVAAERLIAAESARFVARTARSRAATEEAKAVMPMGLPANGQVFAPSALVAREAHGAYLVDLDGNRYLDFNMGYGALFVGHGHPVVMAAVREQLDHGTLFLMPCLDNQVVAGALAARFGQPQWRFTNSGTEATMPAIRAARSVTGRDRVVKVEGAYHGQYDTMLASLRPPRGAAGPVASSSGVPEALLALTSVVPFNDLDAAERALQGRDVACFILEPGLQNVGIVRPAPGYLEGLRALCDATGTLLIFDEVKIGITAHWGGASTLFGVRPDLVCVSKSIGGGLPLGAFGGRPEVMAELQPSRATHVGTFSGNPLSMAAARATLCDVCTPDATAEVIARSARLAAGYAAVIADAQLPAHVVEMGAKGCITWRPQPCRDVHDTADVLTAVARAQWLWSINRGVLTPPGADAQWLLSLQHTDADVDAALGVFADFVDALTA